MKPIKTRIKIIEQNNGEIRYIPQYYEGDFTSYISAVFMSPILLIACIMDEKNYFSFWTTIYNADFCGSDYQLESLEKAKIIIDNFVAGCELGKKQRIESYQNEKAQATKKVTYLKYP